MSSETDILKQFEEHAFFALGFRCKNCGSQMSEEGVVGAVHSEEWVLNLARKARAEGWEVLNEWEAIGPECGRKN